MGNNSFEEKVKNIEEALMGDAAIHGSYRINKDGTFNPLNADKNTRNLAEMFDIYAITNDCIVWCGLTGKCYVPKSHKISDKEFETLTAFQSATQKYNNGKRK